jgi:hypothetical protein
MGEAVRSPEQGIPAKPKGLIIYKHRGHNYLRRSCGGCPCACSDSPAWPLKDFWFRTFRPLVTLEVR